MFPLLDEPGRVLFFTGKGGVGKTSLACATSVGLADRGARVLLVSTDPASNLDEVLGASLGPKPAPVPGVPGLDALNLDPEAAAHAYKEQVVAPYRGVLPDSALVSIEEQLSGACTVEIAAFNEFARLLGDPAAAAGYDHLLFDTAPTGHTLRLLGLPAAWSSFIAANTTGTSCLGPLAGLAEHRGHYEATLAALQDAATTTLVLVTRPEAGALKEAARASTELARSRDRPPTARRQRRVHPGPRCQPGPRGGPARRRPARPAAGRPRRPPDRAGRSPPARPAAAGPCPARSAGPPGCVHAGRRPGRHGRHLRRGAAGIDLPRRVGR